MRQFVAESMADAKGCLVVDGKKFHYLSSVLRVKDGDMIDVRFPDGSLVQMTVASVDSAKKQITMQIAGDGKVTSEAAAPETEIYLFQFAAKPPKMDLIIRQAVECGVSYIVPVQGVFCQAGPVEAAKKKSSGSDDRWSRIITEARQQSGSPVQTKILPMVTVKEACDLWKNISSENSASAIVLYEQTAGTKPIQEAVAGGIKKAAVAVGAEGGISPEEIELLQDGGFIPVHFATNILRCETAALYGLAALQTVMSGR